MDFFAYDGYACYPGLRMGHVGGDEDGGELL